VSTGTVLVEVRNERRRQDEKWGVQSHPDGTGIGPYWSERAEAQKDMNAMAVERGALTWRGILEEEVFEAFAESDKALLRAELLQVAAVAIAWVEHNDRQKGEPT